MAENLYGKKRNILLYIQNQDKEVAMSRCRCIILPLLFAVCVVGCKTTAPSIGYMPPSEDVMNGYQNQAQEGIPNKGIYVDFGKDGGHTTKRAVFVHDINGNEVYRGEKNGEDLVGRLFDNAGVPIGIGTAVASPFWGYFGQKTRRPDRTNAGFSGGTSSSNSGSNSNSSATGGNPSASATSSSGP